MDAVGCTGLDETLDAQVHVTHVDVSAGQSVTVQLDFGQTLWVSSGQCVEIIPVPAHYSCNTNGTNTVVSTNTIHMFGVLVQTLMECTANLASKKHTHRAATDH